MSNVVQDLEKGLFKGKLLENWESNYAQLVAFKDQERQNLLPEPGPVQKDLYTWIDIQRRMQHLLPVPLKNKLAAIDFDFMQQEPDWEDNMHQLSGFYQVNGHTFLPAGDPVYKSLHDWLIRQVHNQQYLTLDQYQRLDALSVDWHLAAGKDLRWQQMYLRLKSFHGVNGHCRVPQKWAQDRRLALWVSTQRRVFASKKMPVGRERLLGQLGFVWNIQSQFDAQWNRFYRQLAVFQLEHGHCQVPGTFPQLVSWIERQRLARKKKLLAADRERKLNDINFIWSFTGRKENRWQQMFRLLLDFKKRHGHCLVPVLYKENKTLGAWVVTQRNLEARQKLSKEKRGKLDRQGFVWKQEFQPQIKRHLDLLWNSHFDKLKAYRQQYGTCQVSVKRDAELQRWTRWQRLLSQQGKLQPERRRQLDAIYFPWNIQESNWQHRYAALVEFKSQNGHTRVPCPSGTNNKLAAWVYRQKKCKAQLTVQQVEQLEAVGFDWQIPQRTIVAWQHMYDRLVAFRKDFGHTRVPVTWAIDPKLGKWVSRMRQEKGRLASDQIDLLNSIAFDWRKRQIRKTACPAN